MPYNLRERITLYYVNDTVAFFRYYVFRRMPSFGWTHTHTHTHTRACARARIHPHVCPFDFRDLINSRKAKRQTSGLRASEASELAVIPLICMFLMSAG